MSKMSLRHVDRLERSIEDVEQYARMSKNSKLLEMLYECKQELNTAKKICEEIAK